MTPITYNKGQVLKWPKFDGPYFPIFDEPNEISHERIFKQLEREDESSSKEDRRINC